jgi:hypothetical protein
MSTVNMPVPNVIVREAPEDEERDERLHNEHGEAGTGN